MIGTKIHKNEKDFSTHYRNCAVWCNNISLHPDYQATIEDKGDYYEVVKVEVSQAEQIQQEVQQLKQYLNDTDYIYAKCIETGEDVTELYAEVIAKRKEARTRIQELGNAVQL